MEKRITNVDTLSALFDRLITENIKLYFFNKDKLTDKADHQNTVITELKNRISNLIVYCIEAKDYNYLSEKRTFDENSIVEELDELIQNDINIGESDRARLEEVKSNDPSLDRMIVNEKRLRKANEGRAMNKNKIDMYFKNLFTR